MKNNFRIFVISLIFAFLIISCFSNLTGEISTLALFPGFMFNWFLEQLLIEILKEPYFILGNYSFVLNFSFYFLLIFGVVKSLVVTLNASRENELQILK